MFKNLDSLINGALGAITQVINNPSMSQNERTSKVGQLLGNVREKVEIQVVKARKEIVIAETKDGNIYQKSWRPTLMYALTGLIVVRCLGLIGPLPDFFAPLMTLGSTGFILGRTAEKIVPGLLEFFKK